MAFLSNIFGYFLNFIYNIVNNYGIAIIIFTVLLKLIMLPFTIKQQRNMKKTARVQAQVREIQERFSNDQVRQSQELMDLYKRENMSPFSGCLGTILQMIVILSMFWLVSRPLTYMKHIDNEVIQGYVQELSEASEGQNARYTEIAVIKNYSDKDENVNINMDFFGLDLSDVPSDAKGNFKVYIIPMLYVITSIVAMKLTSSLTAIPKNENKEEVKGETVEEEKKEEKPEEPIKEEKPKGKKKKKQEEKEEKDEKTTIEENTKEKALVKTENEEEKSKENNEYDAMDEATKQMQIMTPVLSVMIALIAPLGLALYWLVSNILNILERIIISKFFKDE